MQRRYSTTSAPTYAYTYRRTIPIHTTTAAPHPSEEFTRIPGVTYVQGRPVLPTELPYRSREPPQPAYSHPYASAHEPVYDDRGVYRSSPGGYSAGTDEPEYVVHEPPLRRSSTRKQGSGWSSRKPSMQKTTGFGEAFPRPQTEQHHFPSPSYDSGGGSGESEERQPDDDDSEEYIYRPDYEVWFGQGSSSGRPVKTVKYTSSAMGNDRWIDLDFRGMYYRDKNDPNSKPTALPWKRALWPTTHLFDTHKWESYKNRIPLATFSNDLYGSLPVRVRMEIDKLGEKLLWQYYKDEDLGPHRQRTWDERDGLSEEAYYERCSRQRRHSHPVQSRRATEPDARKVKSRTWAKASSYEDEGYHSSRYGSQGSGYSSRSKGSSGARSSKKSGGFWSSFRR
ncbi:hypothetical protein IAT38_006738 [Cryptococcus sp. DSM 104549]